MDKSGVCHLHGCGQSVGKAPATVRLHFKDGTSDVLAFCSEAHARITRLTIEALRTAGAVGNGEVSQGKATGK